MFDLELSIAVIFNRINSTGQTHVYNIREPINEGSRSDRNIADLVGVKFNT